MQENKAQQIIVINAAKGSITNREEIEKTVKSFGAIPLFIEYIAGAIPPCVTAYFIPTIVKPKNK